MIRLFLGAAGLGLSLKMFIKADDFLTQTLMLFMMPMFFMYIKMAIDKINSEKE